MGWTKQTYWIELGSKKIHPDYNLTMIKCTGKYCFLTAMLHVRYDFLHKLSQTMKYSSISSFTLILLDNLYFKKRGNIIEEVYTQMYVG